MTNSTIAHVPRLQLPEKMGRILDSKARCVIIIGGRSSGKSEGVSRILILKVLTERADILCGREYQNSIDDSVHKLLCDVIQREGIQGAYITDKKIEFERGGEFKYKGFARNSEAVRSAQGFKYSWIEEAQDLSEKSIEELLPTIRAPDSQLFFTANPMASNDPFSRRFITPFRKHILKQGFYEDDLHLIIEMNWRDNPWHGELEKQRLWDLEHLSRAKYDHIWEGHFNDSVEDAIIYAEWFDAAIDAHKKLGFKAKGFKIVSHDPSDIGADAKGMVIRHGSVILDAQEKETGDVNDGCDWATDIAVREMADTFIWDCDGLGVSLKKQVTDSLRGKRVDPVMFKGSESPINPTEIYQPDNVIHRWNSKQNKETFKNKRAQYYWMLRDRFYKTFRAVEKKEYIDPDELISISSNIDCIVQLRSEVCRIPIKPSGNGFIQIMTKLEMKNRLKIESPNLADSLMMAMQFPAPLIPPEPDSYHIPDRVYATSTKRY